MGQGDYIPPARRRKADPKQIKKIREGGKKAQKIAHETREKHQKEDVPQAEALLLQGLEEIENHHLKSAEK